VVTEIVVEDSTPPLQVGRLFSLNDGRESVPFSAPIPGAILTLNIAYPDYRPERAAALYTTREATYVLDAEIDWESTALLTGGNLAVRILCHLRCLRARVTCVSLWMTDRATGLDSKSPIPDASGSVGNSPTTS